MKTTLDGAKD